MVRVYYRRYGYYGRGAYASRSEPTAWQKFWRVAKVVGGIIGGMVTAGYTAYRIYKALNFMRTDAGVAWLREQLGYDIPTQELRNLVQEYIDRRVENGEMVMDDQFYRIGDEHYDERMLNTDRIAEEYARRAREERSNNSWINVQPNYGNMDELP